MQPADILRKLQLNYLVKEMIAKHTGGREFYDALDKAVQSEEYFEYFRKLYQLCQTDGHWLEDHHGIASGNFGVALHNWLRGKPWGERPSDWDFGLLLTPGGLRYGNGEVNLGSFAKQIKNKKFVFFDDSFFSGTTRDTIADALTRYGGELVHSFIVYDGSRKEDPKVTSLYRYYDHHKEEK